MTTNNELQTFAQQLQLQMNQMQQTYEMKINQLQQELKYNNENNNNNKNYNSNLKPSKPETFRGDRRVNAEVWLAELENYFTVTKINDNKDRINFAVSQFRELAVIWWKHIQKNNTNEMLTTDWNTFKQTLLKNYKPVEANETARVAIYRLKQQTFVSTYCDIFLKHLNNIEDMNEADQLFLFKQGLQSDILREVNTQHPTTLAEAMSYAQRAEITLRTSNYQRNNRMNYRNNNYNNNSIPRYNNFVHNNNNSSSNSSVPMELSNINAGYENYNTYAVDGDFDATYYTEQTIDSNWDNRNDRQHEQVNEQQNLNALQFNNRNNYPNRYSNSNTGSNVPRVSGLSREQIESCKRTGACFYCGVRGHMKSQCSKLQNKLNANGTQQYNGSGNNNSNPKKY